MDVTITASGSPAAASEVILGIDTHLEVHVAVALEMGWADASES